MNPEQPARSKCDHVLVVCGKLVPVARCCRFAFQCYVQRVRMIVYRLRASTPDACSGKVRKGTLEACSYVASKYGPKNDHRSLAAHCMRPYHPRSRRTPSSLQVPSPTPPSSIPPTNNHPQLFPLNPNSPPPPPHSPIPAWPQSPTHTPTPTRHPRPSGTLPPSSQQPGPTQPAATTPACVPP